MYRVNWSASFRTPDHVRKEWAERLGLTAFTGPEYDKALDAVCQRLSVHTGFRHGPACSALASGLQAAGFDCGEVPRNCVDERCGGHCTFGCARGAKQDSVNTFLADACLSGNTRIVTGLWADRILTESIETTPSGQKRDAQPKRQSAREKKAVGVLAMAAADTTSPCGGSSAVEKEALKVAFVAPLVVSSAGAIHTPALMLRSGIRSRGNVGANLKLHPCTVVVGTFPEDAEIPEYCGEQRSDGCAYPGDCKALGSIR
jgi:long-chain-alcohol oxidase